MEIKLKTLSIFEFNKRFPDDQACLEYLSEIKWRDGFVCPKCGYERYCKGINELDRQCTSCSRLTSPTSGTLFHQIKFPLLKAFYIVYYITTSKNEISSCELSRKLDLRQKTCWSFKRKVIADTKLHKNNSLANRICQHQPLKKEIIRKDITTTKQTNPVGRHISTV